MVQFSEVRREAKVIKLMVPGIVGDPIQTYQMKTRWSMFPGGPKSKIASKLTTGDRIIRYGHERRRMETKLQRTPIRQRRMLEVGGIAKECTMLLHLINNNLFSKALASPTASPPGELVN